MANHISRPVIFHARLQLFRNSVGLSSRGPLRSSACDSATTSSLTYSTSYLLGADNLNRHEFRLCCYVVDLGRAGRRCLAIVNALFIQERSHRRPMDSEV